MPDQPPRAMSIGRAFSLGAFASLLNLLAGLGKGKAAALVLGPAGMGIVAEVTQVVALAFVPNSLAAGPAMVRALAEAERERDHERQARTWRAAFTLALAFALIGAPVAGLLAWRTLDALPATIGLGLVLFSILNVALTTQQTLQRQALIATQQLVPLTKVDAVYAAASLTFAALGVWLGGMLGYVGGALAATALCVPLFGWVLRQGHGDWRLGLTIDAEFTKDTLRLGAATLVNGFLLQGSLVLLLGALRVQGGPELAGLFQACWALAHIHATGLLTSLGRFIFPRYAAAVDNDALLTEMRAAWSFVSRGGPPVVLAAIALSAPLLELVFSAKFVDAAAPLRWMLAGLMTRSLAWTVGSVLLYRGAPLVFTIAQATFWFIFVTIALTAMPEHGLLAVGVSMFIGQCCNLLINLTAVQWAIGLRLPARWYAQAVGVASLGAAAAWTSNQGWRGMALTLLAAAIWSVVAGLHRDLWRVVRARLRRQR